jgi:hypothetical protein
MSVLEITIVLCTMFGAVGASLIPSADCDSGHCHYEGCPIGQACHYGSCGGGWCTYDACESGQCTYGSCGGGHCCYGGCSGSGKCEYDSCGGGWCSYGECSGPGCGYGSCSGESCSYNASSCSMGKTWVITAVAVVCSVVAGVACALCFFYCWKRQSKWSPSVSTMPPPFAVESAEPAAKQMLNVIVPQGSWPGQALHVCTPCGQLQQVRVPNGVRPGHTFSVAYAAKARQCCCTAAASAAYF